MSTRGKRRERFLKEHPRCCYCSGRRFTSEIDHNPPRSLFPDGAVPKDLRFPSCTECNRAKKDAESRAAVVASVFSQFELPSDQHVKDAVDRALAFVERDLSFRSTVLDHPLQMWDFARGEPPGETRDPLSRLSIPHTLPDEWGAALFELGRFFGQALYYRLLKRVTTPEQMIGIAMVTNAASCEQREIARSFGANLTWFVPEPADKKQDPLFGFGATYSADTDTLFFSAERRGSFVWIGVVGALNPRLLGLKDAHIWLGDGSRY